MIQQRDYTKVLGIRRRTYGFDDVSLRGASFVSINVAKVLGVFAVVFFLGWQLGISAMPSWLSACYYLILPGAVVYFIFRPVADDMKVHEWLGVLLKHQFIPPRGYGFGCPRPAPTGVIRAEVWTKEQV